MVRFSNMGNVVAASSTTSSPSNTASDPSAGVAVVPPPPPLTAPPPLETKKESRQTNGSTNPGTFEDLHKKCKGMVSLHVLIFTALFPHFQSIKFCGNLSDVTVWTDFLCRCFTKIHRIYMKLITYLCVGKKPSDVMLCNRFFNVCKIHIIK